MRRRKFLSLLGSAAAWPCRASAQRSPMPLIGFLNHRSRDAAAPVEMALRQGLREAGFVEGENVTIEYRYTDGRPDRLSDSVADLISRRPDVLIAGGSTPAVAVKSSTSTIPVVFFSGGDPVELGLVRQLHRPGGNATGISQVSHSLGAKRLELMNEVVPRASPIAVLFHSGNVSTALDTQALSDAARVIPREIKVLNVASAHDVDEAFASAVHQKAGAILVEAGAFFATRMQQLVTAAARHNLPTMFSGREFAEAGGLMSYGPSITDSYRQVGVYAGRVLKGEKPAEMPVSQPTKFEFVINLKTANALGLTIPPTLLARADEVIE